MLAFALVAAVAVAGILIGVSATGSGGTKTAPKALAGAATTQQLFAGIPQNGLALGSPTAPVTMVEFADPACPYCMQYAVSTLPEIVQRYVRTGRLRLLYNGLAFVGPASDPALRAIQAAGAQNKGWNVLDLLYRNQGDERTNWATTSLLRSVGASVPGLDGAKMVQDMNAPQTTAAIRSAAQQGTAAGVHQTPTFLIGRTGTTLQQLAIQSLDIGAFAPTIEQLAKQ
jgi:protein-disulfide isomerase